MLINIVILLILILTTSVPLCYVHPILIVISFDGFRADYLNQTLTPNMFKLAQNGVQGKMKPQFVSKTYPNHQSIATGLFEDVHGIVNNDFYDPKWNKTFEIDGSSKWWDNNISLPVWIANQLQDPDERFSGLVMWPGQQATYKNIKPKYKLPYDKELNKNWKLKVDKLISWITDSFHPANCIFAYFDEPDETAHDYGPFGNETLSKVKEDDEIIGYLIKKLNQKYLFNRTNIIIVSDHGMAEVSPERVINLDEFLNKSWYKIYGKSPVWSILPNKGYEDKVYSTLKNASGTRHFNVYRREEIPAEYHYRNNERILPIFIVADEGWDIEQNMSACEWKPKGFETNKVWGNHGYNNSLPSMRPLFIAHGPAFKRQHIHNRVFENVDLYPLMNNILQLFAIGELPSNGSLSRVYDMLVPPISPSEFGSSSEKFFKFLLFIVAGFGILFFSGACFVGCLSLGKPRPRKCPNVTWDPLSSGLDIDLHGHMDLMSPTDNNKSNNHFHDHIDGDTTKHKNREETILLLDDDDEEDL